MTLLLRQIFKIREGRTLETHSYQSAGQTLECKAPVTSRILITLQAGCVVCAMGGVTGLKGVLLEEKGKG